MIKKINRKKHKALEEQYDHYVCEFCMEIGAKESISEFLEDLNKIMDHDLGFPESNTHIVDIIEKWEKMLK